MKKYILATFALIAMCFSAMAEKTVANNAFQLNYKNDTVAPLQARLLVNPRFVFSEDGSEITFYKGANPANMVIKVDSVKSLAYIYMPHVHNITLVADTVFPTDETTGTLAYWECIGTEEDPTCHLYFADSLGTDTIGNDSLLNVWLAKDGEGFLPCVYENDKIYAVIGDTLIVRTDRISEMKNVTEDGNDFFHMTYTFLGETQTYHVSAFDLQDGVVFKTGKQLFIPTYVDLGLPSGTRWATCNVGATAPEEFGDYFAWGEVTPKNNYSWETYKWCNGSMYTITKYCTSSEFGVVDNKTVLEAEDDAATVYWGEGSRMPTKDEWNELNDNCTWTVASWNGVQGRILTGPNGKTIFLPAAGNYQGSELVEVGEGANFWSATVYDRNPVGAINGYFSGQYHGVNRFGILREQGFTIRAVKAKKK